MGSKPRSSFEQCFVKLNNVIFYIVSILYKNVIKEKFCAHFISALRMSIYLLCGDLLLKLMSESDEDLMR